MKVPAVLAACMLLLESGTTARESVAIRVSPHIAMAPATVRVVVTVEPDRDNRELVLQADSDWFFTSSTVELEGDRAPRLQSFVFKELPAGNYELTARVLMKTGESRMASSDYTVLE